MKVDIWVTHLRAYNPSFLLLFNMTLLKQLRRNYKSLFKKSLLISRALIYHAIIVKYKFWMKYLLILTYYENMMSIYLFFVQIKHNDPI